MHIIIHDSSSLFKCIVDEDSRSYVKSVDKYAYEQLKRI